jgi:hypothetical protein
MAKPRRGANSVKDPKTPEPSKRVQIDKAQSTMIAVIACATIVTIFCLVSMKSLFSQATYQRRVVNARNLAVKQLQANVTSAHALDTQYNNVFEGSDPVNIIGGKNDSSATATPPDGDNARVVLDALPSKYDFPATVTSISNLLASDGLINPSITGTDQTATISSDASANPKPAPIQFDVQAVGSYSAVQTFIKDLERSIRPFDVTNLTLSGNESQMTVSLTVNTYFQPAKSLTFTTKEIK